VNQAGAGNPDDKSGAKHAQSSQMLDESAQVTGADAGSNPNRNHRGAVSRVLDGEDVHAGAGLV